MNNLSTSKWKEFRDYTVDRIRMSTVDWDPYWHVLIPDTLHPDLFQLVKEEWPDFSKITYYKNPEGFNQNRKIYDPHTSNDLTFWSDYFANIIDHKEIIDAVYNLDGLIHNCDFTTCSIWEDYKGYSVSNHYDAYTISVAWQSYIYCDGGKKWGTSLNDETGNCIKRFPFVENTSWLMRVDANSWHSCDEVDCNVRQSVMARFMTTSRS